MEPSLILLSLGTHQQPFSRALDLVEPLTKQGAELIIQHGSTPPRLNMPNTTWVQFMPYSEVVTAMTKADGVLCHAGVGTIMTALQLGHIPIVFPRLARYGEHVDDHQLDIADSFAEQGLIRRVDSKTDLASLLGYRGGDTERIGKGSNELRAAVSDAVAAPARHRRFVLRLR